MENSYPVYEARVGALGSVRAWHEEDTNSYRFVYFNGFDYTPLYLSEEAAYYTWAFLSMMHPEAHAVISQPSVKTKSSKCKPAPKKHATKKKKLVKKK
jgi:hypothetical protein